MSLSRRETRRAVGACGVLLYDRWVRVVDYDSDGRTSNPGHIYVRYIDIDLYTLCAKQSKKCVTMIWFKLLPLGCSSCLLLDRLDHETLKTTTQPQLLHTGSRNSPTLYVVKPSFGYATSTTPSTTFTFTPKHLSTEIDPQLSFVPSSTTCAVLRVLISKPAFYFFATLVNFIAGKGGNKRKVTTYAS